MNKRYGIFFFIKDTPYLTLLDKLWEIFCEQSWGKWYWYIKPPQSCLTLTGWPWPQWTTVLSKWQPIRPVPRVFTRIHPSIHLHTDPDLISFIFNRFMWKRRNASAYALAFSSLVHEPIDLISTHNTDNIWHKSYEGTFFKTPTFILVGICDFREMIARGNIC